MDKRGFYYGILLYLILGLLVLSISIYFIFGEYFSGEGSDREVCAQSIQLRALMPEIEAASITLKELKSGNPLKCKTDVVEISESDVKDIEKAQAKIAGAMAECWHLFGNGDYNAFPPGAFGTKSACVPCARIHLSDNAKEYMRDKKIEISIESALNLKMPQGFTYYSYLRESGSKFSAFDFGNKVKFDLDGDDFYVGGDSIFNVFNHAEFYLGDFNKDLMVGGIAGVGDLRVDDFKKGSFGAIAVSEHVLKAGEEMNALVSGVSVFEAEGGGNRAIQVRRMGEILKQDETFEMTGDWDLSKIEGMVYSDVFESATSGKIIVSGKVSGFSDSFAKGMGDGFELEVLGGKIGNTVEVAKGMEGGVLNIGCKSDIDLGIGREMTGGELGIYSSDVMSVGSDMEGGEIVIGEGSMVFGYVGFDMIGGEIIVEKGANVECPKEDCGFIRSESDLDSCGCFDSEALKCEGDKCIRFEEDVLDVFDGRCVEEEIKSSFCKGKRYAGVCEILEKYSQEYKGEGEVKLKEDRDNGWVVDVNVVKGTNSDGEVELYNRQNRVKLNVSFATTEIRLPGNMNAEDGDLMINYGVVVTHEKDFGNYIPYMFYFQSGQKGSPFERVKKYFVSGGLLSVGWDKIENIWNDKEQVESSAFCSYWEGIPA